MISPEPGPSRQQEEARSLAERRRRLGLLGVVFGVAFLSVGLRLLHMVDWSQGGQGLPRPVGTAIAEPTPEFVEVVPAPASAATAPRGRAEITDRNGELIATNLTVPSLFVDPSAIADKRAAARRLAAVLREVDPERLAKRLESRRRFAWVKHQITPEEQAAVLELGIPGMGFRPAQQRVYPKQALTSHVTGFVDIDGRGLAGIERALDDRLSTGAGKGPVALSLDLRVQQIVREELFSAYVQFRAKGANAIVLDAATGEVLAMVSLPDFDPNHPDEASEAQRLNRNTGGTYELGSLFKVISTAAALDSGQVALHDSFDATQALRLKGAVINDVHAKRRTLTVPECFMYSSNICTAKIALAAGGGAALDPFFRRLGFYEKPDIELPQPELGTPQLPVRKWTDVTTATTSYGHGIAISSFQYVAALAGLMREGAWARPTLLRRADSTPVPTHPAPVSARTAADLRWLMWLTVEKGTGALARQPAYLMGGKTGTADKPKENGRGYQKGAVLASFAAVFPIEAPRYVVLAVVDEPRGDASTHGTRYGGQISAPVVRDIVDRVGPLLGVEPSRPAAREPFAGRLVVTKVEGQKEERIAAVGPGR